MAGNAVGLGNFLRFPVQAAQNGGGAFMIPYFISFLLLGIPLMWVEWTIGRYGGRFGHSSLPGMFDKMWKHPAAKYLGVLGLIMPVAVMIYYTYVESWSLGYAIFTATGKYWGNDSAAAMGSFLAGYQGWGGPDNPFFSGISWAWLMFIITLSVNVYVLSKGISGGIEVVARFALPALFVLAAILVVRVLLLGAPDPAQPDFSVSTGMGFIWNPQLDQLADPGIWLAAAGQIFFTLSLGMGTIHCYASYLAESDDIALTGLATASTNEFAEVVLGGTLAIPAAVAFFGLDATRELAQDSYNLAFAVMPALFQKFPFGQLFGTLWFGLLFIAGITSSLAQGQPLLSFMQEEYGFTRKKAALVLGLIVFVLCQPVIFFINHGWLNEMDYWAGTFGLVILATVEIILFAWMFGMKKGWDEMTHGADIRIPLIFRFIITWVTPLLLLIILGRWAILELPGKIMMTDVQDVDKPYVLAARIVMLLGFLALCLLVRHAWKKRERAESEVEA
jgi:SNF family Na+-dependent transporter